MKKVLIIRYGEISLKGFNRHIFEDRLLTNIKNRLKPVGNFDTVKGDSRLYLELNDKEPQPIAEAVAEVFGVVSASIAEICEANLDQIYQLALSQVREVLYQRKIGSFKVVSRRGDKKFPLTSLEISREVGAYLLENIPELIVDVHNPDLTIYVEIRDIAYVYTQKLSGPGGMPYGTSGKGLLLLSGGIDSPVAGWLMAKRGVELEALHFHSFPFTSERAQEKVNELAQILSRYCRRIHLHTVNLLNIQTAIREKCPEELFTILSRRFMMFIAERIAQKVHCDALITGENIAQVASQTIQSLHVTNAAVNLPVFRPLIAMDKTEIVALAEKIGTYETSILPYEDCCTVFLPKRPATKPRLEKVIAAEAKLDKEVLISEALQNSHTTVIKYS